MNTTKIWATLDPFIEGGDIVGRKVANSSFLQALLQADPFDEYHFFLEGEAALVRHSHWLTEHFAALQQRGAFTLKLRQELHKSVADIRYHAFHLSDCLQRPVALARLRNAFSPHIFPITSFTHSLSYERFMPGYFDYLWGGTTPRDAIIVTSRSAKDMLEATFAGFYSQYALSRDAFFAPRLEHIPLGVPEASLAANQDAEAGARLEKMRNDLQLQGIIVILVLARISPYSKMDILPALAALKRAESLGLPPASYALIVAGWAEENDPLPEALAAYASAMGIRLVPVVRPSNEDCQALYALADIFLSPSDNIQETFGLTLVEAGAAGLPVIAADFDGYRDIIKHEETGLLIPTLGFHDTGETDILAGLWFDNQYHLKLAQQVAVDVPALANALARLGTSPSLRHRLGQAARERVASLFSWRTVIQAYCNLWERLGAEELSPEQEAAVRAARHPLHMEFSRCFAGHFSETLTSEKSHNCVVRRTARGDALYQGVMPPLRYAGMEHMLDDGVMRRILLTARKPATLAALIDAALAGGYANGVGQERIAACVLWLLKHDYLEKIV